MLIIPSYSHRLACLRASCRTRRLGTLFTTSSTDMEGRRRPSARFLISRPCLADLGVAVLPFTPLPFRLETRRLPLSRSGLHLRPRRRLHHRGSLPLLRRLHLLHLSARELLLSPDRLLRIRQLRRPRRPTFRRHRRWVPLHLLHQCPCPLAPLHHRRLLRPFRLLLPSPTRATPSWNPSGAVPSSNQ